MNNIVKHEITPEYLALLISIAPIIYESKRYTGNIANAQQATLTMLKGHELGLLPTASLELIEVIDGKMSIKPQLMMALIHRSRNFDMTITDHPDRCEVWMKRRDTGFEYTAIYTEDDAAKAGLIKAGGAWMKQRGVMLQWRAIAKCARLVAPDVLAGMYATVELHTEWADDEGDVIEVPS